jgi:uncharacterized protein
LRFWDTSSIVPLVVDEETTELMKVILSEDAEIAVWWGTEVECVGALSGKFRRKRFNSTEVEQALAFLADLMEGWTEVLPTDQVRVRSERILFSRNLSAADAMQLAAALLWCDDDPREAAFVCQDNQLRTAARLEGFTVLPTSEQLGERI